MSKQMRHALLGGVAALTLVVAAGGAQAQVQSPGWFGSLTGWYYLDSGSDSIKHGDSDRDFRLKVAPDDGLGGKIYLGYRFSNPWDIAIGLQGSWLNKGKKNLSTDNYSGGDTGAPCLDTSDSEQSCSARARARYWAGDAEVGYTTAFNSVGMRFFLGVRYAQFDHRTKHNTQESTDTRNTYGISSDQWGVGPRLGMSFTHQFTNTKLSIFGDVAGSVLFGKRKTRFDEPETTNSTVQKKKSATTWNAEGQIGLAYEIAPMVNVGVGYRAEYWSNVSPTSVDRVWNSGTSSLNVSGSGDRLMHGPFMRVTYNIGAPRAPAPAPVAPAPAAVMTKNFIVFFDWDRADLTMQSKATISQAAAASKTGGVQRINVTGHADKSGTDAYNMAISLRRANNVRDELVRNGVPANAIVVVARGESQPLVPTADGVREPQNRRVEIVLN